MRSAYLGQYTDETANEIAGEFTRKGIAWSYKQAGFISRVIFLGEWGTRLFVEADRLDEAKAIAERIERKREGG